MDIIAGKMKQAETSIESKSSGLLYTGGELCYILSENLIGKS